MDGSFARGLIPTPDPLPAPWWLIESLEHATFLVHILLANLVFGGVLLALAGRRGAGEGLTSKLPTLMALTITAGVAPLLFLQVQYGHLFYTSAVLMALWWVLLVPLVVLAYYGLYLRRRWETAAPGRARVVTLFSAAVFLWVGFLFINGLSLMGAPESWTRWFAAPEGRLLFLADPTIWPRLLHFVLASLAVSGLFLALLWRLRGRSGAAGAAEAEARGLRLFAHATLVNLAVGLWYYLAQPSPLRKLFMGGDAFMTALFAVGFAGTLVAIVVAWRGKLAASLATFGVTFVTMILMRATLRAASLEGVMDSASLPMQPQYDVLAVFLVVLCLGIWAVVTMLRWSTRPAVPGEGVGR